MPIMTLMVSLRAHWMVCVAAIAASFSACGQSLVSRLDAVLAEKSIASEQMSVVVARLGTAGTASSEILYQRNGKSPLIPASNLKVVTSSAALAELGREFKFRTVLALRDAGTGVHDVVLVGDGDPTLGDPEFSSENASNPVWLLDRWAGELAARGVKSVRHVIVDDSVFDEDFIHSGWPADQLNLDYVAQISGMSWQFNCVKIVVSPSRAVRTVPETRYVAITNQVKAGKSNSIWATRPQGSNQLTVMGSMTGSGSAASATIPIHDPGGYTATLLSEALARHGVTVTGIVGKNRQMRQMLEKAPSAFTVVGIHETPIAAVLPRVNKDSANLYAEALIKRLGHAKTGQPGSWANGRAAVISYLQGLGLESSQFVIDDGCGLSRGNRISGELLVRVLAADFAGPNRDVFLSSLSVGGRDGTLRKRFSGDLAGRVYGKTGYINQVSTMSGIVAGKNGQWFAFAALFNDLKGGTAAARQAQEKIVAAIDATSR